MEKTIYQMDRLLKCGYCNRFLPADQADALPDNSTGINCTACGHGKCVLIKPKVPCMYCGKPIYQNVNKDDRVLCSHCTVRAVAHIENLEKKLGVQIKTSEDYSRAINGGEGLYTGTDLLEARKKRGWGQRTMADYFGCSQMTVSRMETGEYPISGKAQAFISRGSET